MVNAILAGRKTQTRRIIKPQPPEGYSFLGLYGPRLTAVFTTEPSGIRDVPATLPYMPGDRLWVREAFALVGNVDPGWVLYRASGYDAECERHGFSNFPPESEVKWRPSIHMPRWASRITLAVTEVRVQRLQDISEEDAKAEGVEQNDVGLWKDYAGDEIGWGWPVESFCSLWASIHGPGAWDANPWVAAITFERVK